VKRPDVAAGGAVRRRADPARRLTAFSDHQPTMSVLTEAPNWNSPSELSAIT
jgi:hypothetical protein